MNTKRIFGVVAIVVIVAFILVGTTLSTTDNAPQVPGERVEAMVTFTIEGFESEEVSIEENQTILSVLEMLNVSRPTMQLKTKTYSGLGTLVTGIGGLENGAGQEYWQYKVNSMMPLVGADQYLLKNGDIVEWYFAASDEQYE